MNNNQQKKCRQRIPRSMILLFILIFFSGFMQLSAAFNIQKTKLSLKVTNASLEYVMNAICSQSQFSFFFDDAAVKKISNITLNVKDISIEEIMTLCLENTNFSYRISDKTIILFRNNQDIQQNENKQSYIIKGKVIDEQNIPMGGVTIRLEGTQLGTATDVEGNFSIELPQAEGKLIFSFIGYKTQIINYTANKDIIVEMQENISKLDEVIITGYQRIDKRKNASSVISVKGSDLQEGAAISIDNMLQGKLAGVNILNPSSTPGAAPKIRIRGASSISGNREPVWVVDGIILEDPVPISAEELNSLDNINIIGNAIASINPEDIERIDILKDASATAIYGVKAANGVIVITTKKGQYGKPRVNYSGNIGLSFRPSYNNLNRMNSKERIDVSKEIEQRGLTFKIKPSNIGYEGALYDLYAKHITQEEFVERVYQLEKINTDWYDELFRTDVSHKHSLSISGGTDAVNYYFSAGYAHTNAVIKKSNMENYNALLKLNIKLTSKLNIGLSLRAYNATKRYLHGSIDPYQYAYNTSRAIPAYHRDGSYLFYNKTEGYETILNYNILNERENSGRKIQNQAIDFITDINYKILSSLTLSGVFSLSKSNTKDSEWANEKSFYIANLRGVNYGDELPTDRNFITTRCHLPYGGELRNDNTLSSTYTIRAGLNYYKNFQERHEIDLNIGTEVRSVKYNGISTIQRGYLPDRGKKFVSINPTEWTLYNDWLIANPDVVIDRLTNIASFYGTFTYSFDNCYTVNFNIRTDGSNKFGQDKSTKFLPVWSAAIRWNIHNESFLRNIQWLNLLALKGSYGIQGNVHSDQTPDLIVAMSGMDNISKEYISTLSKLQNPFLKWEKTKSYNLALEFAFFNNRINGYAEFYMKKGKDQVITKQVSTVSGKKDVSINGGNVENKGWEFTLSGTPIKTKYFTWGLSLNMYQNYNKVTSKHQTQTYNYKDYLQGNLIMESKPLDGFYSYKFDGLDQDGLPMFKDIDEPDGISKEEMFAKAFVYSGKRVADFNGGFSTYFSYKGLTLNALFAFSIGKKVRLNNLYESFGQTLPLPQQNMSNEFVNRWQKDKNENTNIPALSDLSLAYSDMDRKYIISNNKWEMYNNADLRVVSGNFLRMRNLSLSYNLPKNIYKNSGISSINLRIEAGNLFVWKNKKLRGQDPEQITLGSGTVPPTKNFTFGLNISL